MAPKITPTMKNSLPLWNLCKHWPLYTLSIAPVKIIFLNFFLPVFFSNLLLSIHAIKGTKFDHLVPLGIFEIIHTFLEWNYLRGQ